MKLRLRTIAVVAIAILCLNLALTAASSHLLLGGFRELEARDVRRSVERVLDVLLEDLADLDTTAQDYAEWDDTYAFVRDRNPTFVRSNLVDRTFDYLRLNAFVILDESGGVVFSRGYDLAARQAVPLSEHLMERLQPGSLLLQHGSPTDSTRGILVLPEGPMLAASRPVTTSTGQGEIRGTLLAGRYLGDGELARISRLTQLALTVEPAAPAAELAAAVDTPTALAAAPADFRVPANWPERAPQFEPLAASPFPSELVAAGSFPLSVQPVDAETIAGIVPLDDLYGEPGLLLRVELAREVFAQGQSSVRYLAGVLLVVGLVLGLLTLVLLERLVLARLMQLSDRVRKIGTTADLSARVEPLPGNDELAELAAIVNDTLDRLEGSQQALREAERKYRSIFENSIEGIFQTHPDGRYLSANPALAQIYGYESPAALMAERNANADLYVQPGRRAEFAAAIAAEGAVSRFESEVRRRDGSHIWISEDARAVCDADGTLLYYEGTVEDITERKQAEAELRAVKDRIQAILEAVPGSVSRVSRDLRYLEVNRHLAATFGLQPENFVDRDIGFLGYGRDFRAFVEDFFESDRAEDTREVTREAGARQEHYLVVAQKYDNDRAAFIVGIDITERKAAERALRQAEAKYRSIFENAIEGIFQATPDGKLIGANPALARIFGYDTPEDLLADAGQTRYADRSRAAQLMGLLREFGRVSQFESEALRLDGSRIWISENASVVRGPDGHALYYEGTVEDITERRRAQEALVERSRLSILQAEVGVALGRGGDLAEILGNCAEMMLGQLGCTFVRVWTYNAPEEVLELQAQASLRAERPLSLDVPLLRNTLRDRLTLDAPVVGAVARDLRPHFEPSPLSDDPDSPLLHFAGYPLVVEARLVGVMALYSRAPLAEAVQDALGWIANAIAVGIDRAWARQELTSRREALLFQLASQIRKSLDLDAILEATVGGIFELLQVDRCLFAWYRPGHGEDSGAWIVANEAREPALLEAQPAIGGAIADELMVVLSESRVLRADDASSLDDPLLRSFLQRRGYSSALIVPVQTRSGAVGAIECGQCGVIRTWSNSDLELLRAVTEQLAVAIYQAELYNQARTAALQAQQQADRLSDALQELTRTQTQLIQTEKMSSLGQMVAGVAHEINNPTTFIHGNLTYAKTYARDLLHLLDLFRQHYPQPVPEVAEAIAEIDADFLVNDLPKTLESMRIGAERIRQIVISLRNFSRLDRADMMPVDVHEGIENTLLILQHRLKANSHYPGIQVVKDYGDLPQVVCYAGQLNQVFMNVLANAIDALEDAYDRSQQAPIVRARAAIEAAEVGLPGGGATALSTVPPAETPDPPTITIRTERVAPDRVRICIRDNGPGIAEPVRAKLFDPFFTTKPVGRGTGLGLSIAYQIVVDKHRGMVDCTSAPGEGTEFRIEIPTEQPEWTEST